jgi:two-component system, NtrC family, sensor kinase
MPETKPTRGYGFGLTRSLSARLTVLLLATTIVSFALLGYFIIRLHQEHLEAATLLSAERVSDVIKRSTTEYMLRNDREGLYRAIHTMADQPGMAKVRIVDAMGGIRYSTDAQEINDVVDKTAASCVGCHSHEPPQMINSSRFRIYNNGDGRILGVITPIENQPACSNANCHAHPPNQRILGVLDTNLSLAQADKQLAQSSNRMVFYMLVAAFMIAVLCWLAIRKVVAKPFRSLTRGTEHLSHGDLGYQIQVGADDELGDLAQSFNAMSLQLRAASEEKAAWAKKLEERVEEKTSELKRAHEHVLQVEKMASIGKLAAVVAHEINNPLSGILTYAKLLERWLERHEIESKKVEAKESLELIAAESRRCGEIVKNLLVFSRAAPMNVESTSVNAVVERSLKLVQHQLQMNGIDPLLSLANDLPRIPCDPGQIEQVIVALVENAIDAMPHGGNLWVKTRLDSTAGHAVIEVRDDGCGIPLEVIGKIFEPFLTTKETGRGVGLGLAVSRSIIERHGGQIQVRSMLGQGTTFVFSLPLEVAAAESATPKPELANAR